MAQVKQGVVISNKMTKTVVVKVNTKVKDPFYKKLITKTKKFNVHDDIGVNLGDKVKITEIKPVSKNVHFKILEVLK